MVQQIPLTRVRMILIVSRLFIRVLDQKSRAASGCRSEDRCLIEKCGFRSHGSSIYDKKPGRGGYVPRRQAIRFRNLAALPQQYKTASKQHQSRCQDFSAKRTTALTQLA